MTKLRKEAALSALVEQQKEKEAVEAENAANNAKLLENIAHERQLRKSIAEMHDSHRAEINAVLDKYQSLLGQGVTWVFPPNLHPLVRECHEPLDHAMGVASVASVLEAVHIR
ncbi:hypothetical protein WJX75_003513 [Coccomyxa subellipsoidea]|uniref:Uncharacterized protein n=1 Tax=Coccomyxa subellipsoidea TaxID=248742 RepID=A0ABR2YR39_9CHLO